MKKIFFTLALINLLVLLLVVYSDVWGATVDIGFVWTDINTEADGFRLYQGETLVEEIADPAARSWSGQFEVVEGRTLFYLTAYNATKESAKSKPAAYEYMETPGLMSPTVLIKFTN